MFISKNLLKRAKPENVIRLAHFVGLTTYGKTMEQIIEETHMRINWNM
jgi:hypothetical protein